VPTYYIVPILRAGLEYGGEVHQTVKSFSPNTRLFETTIGMANNMKRQIVKNASSWSSLKAKFLVQGSEVAQET
jgi:hypothetical protein